MSIGPHESQVAFAARLLASIGQPIIATDTVFRVIYWNRGAEAMLGWTSEEMFGVDIVEAAGIQLSAARADSLLEQLSSGQAITEDFQLTRRDGHRLPVLVHITPLLDEDGEFVGMVANGTDITDRYELEHQAAEEHQRLEEAQQIARIGSFDYDVATDTVRWSRELRRILGLGDEAVTLGQFLALLPPESERAFRDHLDSVTAAGAVDMDVTYRIRRTDGEERWLRTLGRLAYGSSSDVARVVGSTQDITEGVRDEEARRVAEQQFSLAFESGSVGMCILDLDRKVRQVNPTICRMFGREADELIGHVPDEFAHPGDLSPRGGSPTEVLLSSGQDHVEMERRYVRPEGETFFTIVHLAVVRDVVGEPMYTLAQVVDISDRKRVEEELERLAMQDPLTGLPNRNLLQDRLGTALMRSRRTESKVAVIFVDVDHFKLVNDSLGHSAGDDLLRQLGHRLGGCTKGGDTVARFGGDEFVLVCEDVEDAEEATVIGQRVRAVCDEAFVVDEQQMYVTVSCGIVVAAEDDTPLTLLRDADTAMYRAKERGRARIELFDPDLRSRATRRLDIELALRRALERDEFRLEYQPILHLPAGPVAGVEALIRWDHPERGLVPPTEFIPAAEETGLIGAIGEWVLDKAIAQTALWRRTLPGAVNLVVGVNLSPRQLLIPEILKRLRDLLAAHELTPDGLCLEITESAAMDDVDVSVPLLRRIADSGIILAVDDFGVGYSSLSRLKRLPVRVLKIDRSFIDGLGTDTDDSSIVHAIVRMGQALNLLLCAEGVETEIQRTELVKLGCNSGQGYLWSRPLRPEAFEAWFSSTGVLAVLPG